MQTNSTEKYFLFVLLSLAIILTIAIVYPFIAVLVLSAALAVVLSPVYNWIKTKLVRNISWLASLLTIMVFLICLCIPLFFVGKAIFYQAQNMYLNIMTSGSSSHFIDSLNNSMNRLLPTEFSFDLHDKIMELTSSLTSSLTSLFTSTVNSVLMFFLLLFTTFYLLIDGNKWKEEFINIIPLSNENANEILMNLRRSINRIFKGSFIIAIAQAILAWIGFTIFGIPNAIIWAMVAGIASFIPTVGTSVVSGPAILFLFFTGMQWQALGLLIWSIIIVGTVDNILNPYVISKDTNIPSLFILFAILGGISLIGPIGILIGPLVLSFLYSLISIYKKELKN